MSLGEYQRRLEEALEPFINQTMTPMNISSVEAIVRSVQREFLFEYPRFVAPYEPQIESTDLCCLKVNAPVITVEENAELLYRAKEAHRLAALEALKQSEEEATCRRRAANMRRQHRRLSGKYLDQNTTFDPTYLAHTRFWSAIRNTKRPRLCGASRIRPNLICGRESKP